MSERPSNPHIQRRRDERGVHAEAWQQTLDEMDALAADRRADGWEVLTVMAAHTDTVSRDMREHDRFGLSHIVPDSDADAFAELYDEDAFDEYLAYGTEVEQYMYLVTELVDAERERSIMIASQYDTTFAPGMVENAREEGVLHTYVKRIDGTILATVDHEAFEPLIAPRLTPGDETDA